MFPLVLASRPLSSHSESMSTKMEHLHCPFPRTETKLGIPLYSFIEMLREEVAFWLRDGRKSQWRVMILCAVLRGVMTSHLGAVLLNREK